MDDFIEKGFREELAHLLKSGNFDAELAALSADEAEALGRGAARTVVAPWMWSAAVGARCDIQTAASQIGTSRQNIYKRVGNGSMLGLRGRGTTWFPMWQFDTPAADEPSNGPGKTIVRPAVARIIRAFRDADETVDPLVIAGWATTPNRLLENLSPAEWLIERADDDQVVIAATRAAAGLAA